MCVYDPAWIQAHEIRLQEYRLVSDWKIKFTHCFVKDRGQILSITCGTPDRHTRYRSLERRNQRAVWIPHVQDISWGSDEIHRRLVFHAKHTQAVIGTLRKNSFLP